MTREHSGKRNDDQVERLLTTAEMADILRVEPNTLLLWARRGRVPSIRMGARTVRFDRLRVVSALDGDATDPKAVPS